MHSCIFIITLDDRTRFVLNVPTKTRSERRKCQLMRPYFAFFSSVGTFIGTRWRECSDGEVIQVVHGVPADESVRGRTQTYIRCIGIIYHKSMST